MAMKQLKYRQLARRIIPDEQSTEPTPHDIAATAVRIYTRVLACISAIIGEAGSVALLRRSLRLAQVTYPFYSAAQDTQADKLLSEIGTCLQTQRAEVAHEASVGLLAIHLELLATFIGLRLTEQLLQEAWPDLRTSPSKESQA